jgi:hypothetical protein
VKAVTPKRLLMILTIVVWIVAGCVGNDGDALRCGTFDVGNNYGLAAEKPVSSGVTCLLRGFRSGAVGSQLSFRYKSGATHFRQDYRVTGTERVELTSRSAGPGALDPSPPRTFACTALFADSTGAPVAPPSDCVERQPE